MIFGSPSSSLKSQIDLSLKNYNEFRANENLIKYDFKETRLIAEFLQFMKFDSLIKEGKNEEVNLIKKKTRDKCENFA